MLLSPDVLNVIGDLHSHFERFGSS